MRQNLVDERRTAFFMEGLALAARHAVIAIVVVVDRTAQPANAGVTPETDATIMLLERVQNRLAAARTEGLVIVDRPGGGRPVDEEAFLLTCLETIQAGTPYVRPDRIAINAVSTSSALVRLVQMADVVTSCTVARVAGERQFSPGVFEAVRPLLAQELGRSGGVGLKLHPDFRYANLYHWLLGDQHFVRANTGHPLPMRGFPYAESADRP
jgi:hypothetical protein